MVQTLNTYKRIFVSCESEANRKFKVDASITISTKSRAAPSSKGFTAHRQIYLPLLYVTHLLLCFMIALNSNDVELASHQPLFK